MTNKKIKDILACVVVIFCLVMLFQGRDENISIILLGILSASGIWRAIDRDKSDNTK